MLDSALTYLGVPGPVAQAELRALRAAQRAARELPGFRECQAFRGIRWTDVVLVYTRWEDQASVERGLTLAAERARAAGRRGPHAACHTTALATCFDLRFPHRELAATLLRVASSPRALGPAAAGREKDLALRAMAEPGSIAALGAQSARRHLSVCRIDFDLEDGLWGFLESPLRQEWTSLAQRLGQREVWALNLPRLSRAAADEAPAPPAAGHGLPAPTGPLTVRLSGVDAGAATIELGGCLDAHGAVRFESVVHALLRDGCRRFSFDLRALGAVTQAGLNTLVGAIRNVKAAGGEAHLVELDQRFHRATRAHNLERSLHFLATREE
jgi:anti-anti-sigma factor